MSTVLATIAKHRNSMMAFDRQGGADSFWGRKYAYEELLTEQHEAAGECDPAKGAYRFKKMGWYSNIVSMLPAVKAAKDFLGLGYTVAHLQELEKWYAGGECRGGIDEVTLAVYLRLAIRAAEKDGLDKAIADMEKVDPKVTA